MQQNPQQKAGAWQIRLNKLKTYFSKPQNVVLLLMGIVLTITTVAPIVAIVRDTFVIHPGTIDQPLDAAPEHGAAFSYVLRYINTIRRRVCFPYHKDKHEIQKIPELHIYIPIHNAPVDPGGSMAEPL